MIDLRKGDCVQILKEIQNESIDMVLTSPPYDNLRSYNNCDWTFEIFKNIANQLKRVLKPGGVIVWIVGDQTINGSETGSSFKQALYFMDIGLNLHDTMIYEKDGCPFPEKNRYYPIFEYMFIFSKGKPKTVNLIADRKNNYAGYKLTGSDRQKDGSLLQISAKQKAIDRRVKEYGIRFNIWKYSVGYGKSAKEKTAYKHPAIFPYLLAKDHIISWSNKNDIVLDCFMGSGTTGVACKELNRNFIGIEISENYFNLAKTRINNHNVQLTIFD